MRNMLSMSSSSTLRLSKGLKPNSVRTACRNCVGVSWVCETTAYTTSSSSSDKNDCSSVVFPEPISPVMTTNPSASQMVDSI